MEVLNRSFAGAVESAKLRAVIGGPGRRRENRCENQTSANRGKWRRIVVGCGQMETDQVPANGAQKTPMVTRCI